MDSTEIKELFANVNSWQQGDKRAPHKPLLILYALGRYSRGEPREIQFTPDFDTKFTQLLREFGTSKSPSNSHHPFWYLRNDGIWKLSKETGMVSRKGKKNEPLKRELIRHQVFGEFIEPIYQKIVEDRLLLIDLAEQTLELNFPESLYEDILSAVGLDLSKNRVGKKKRDPQFRERVMRAYEYRCAICGFDVRLGNMSVGLDAAHIKWHQAGGPDTEDNGLALCVLHHKIFDLGGLTINLKMCVELSENLYGRQGFHENFHVFHGKPIYQPKNLSYQPNQKYLEWHKKQVFKEPALGTEASH
jgi:putative restriction endonuclease